MEVDPLFELFEGGRSRPCRALEAAPRGPKPHLTWTFVAGTVAPSAGLEPGPDVVHPEAEARWAMVGGTYRKVNYCGVETRRCVPFPTESVPSSCSEESLQYATIGMNDGVYPIEVLRCELPWALIELDRCGGYHGVKSRSCTGDGTTRIIMEVTDRQWHLAGFQEKRAPYAGQQQLPGACRDDPNVPAWVCEIVK